MNICIGGDLAGQEVVGFDKQFFNASEVEDSKTSEYRRQPYIIDNVTYRFWISGDLKLWDATDQVEAYIRHPKH
ncbi:hypothetical protein NI467_06290 [Acinetobacter bohemicus]|uniref:hypothetical protein n=1 Tax=Acinetobacter sp. S4397-1 TaxID=2972915 RepID=UPI00209B285C|nr:hypothetical protein [Acinetobacter sp. S4397-1]MCO8044966.1 hypothetical protein [Acinetobacter sp. S4397-1]